MREELSKIAEEKDEKIYLLENKVHRFEMEKKEK